MSRFSEILASVQRDGLRLNQHIPEFRTWLRLCAWYFQDIGVFKPVVVEIGILDGAQRRFYEQLLGAEYIGIDIDPKAPADIHGDSSAPGTIAQLQQRLDDQPMDVLFIDGLHTYEGAKADLEAYGPLCRHIIGIHDIRTPKISPQDTVNVIPLWAEIMATNKTDTILSIDHFNPRDPRAFNGRPLGIGVLLKNGGE
jgi:hypothetical protein